MIEEGMSICVSFVMSLYDKLHQMLYLREGKARLIGPYTVHTLDTWAINVSKIVVVKRPDTEPRCSSMKIFSTLTESRECSADSNTFDAAQRIDISRQLL